MALQTTQEKIEELKARINLIEGDRKAYFENSEWTLRQNKDAIAKLRRENKDLRKHLGDSLKADDHVINKAFQDRKVERAAMKNKTGASAINIQDQKLSDEIKQLNQLRHESTAKQKQLEKLQTDFNQMVKDASEAVASDAGESTDALTLRNLENRMDKSTLKCNEAEQIRKTYMQIKAKLEEEALQFPNQLNEMEEEIKKCSSELKGLRLMKNDAHISKEAAVSELHRHEEYVYSERKQREIELQKMKKEAEERKLQHERTERRIAARTGTLVQDDLVGGQDKQQSIIEDQAAKIVTYEEAFKQIKEATGVSDTAEVVLRFENQGATTTHLMELKQTAVKQIERLKEDKASLKKDFEEMKYSGEAKLSSGQKMLEEFEAHLQKEEGRRDNAWESLDRQSTILFTVKNGVQHLADKLQHLKASKGHVPTAQISPSSDEYVLDLLSVSEEKLLKLLEELDGKDLAELMSNMQEEEFHANLEGKLPLYNTRVKLPQTQRDNVYDDEDDSGEDENDVLTRNHLKKQAQQLIDSKNKRRTIRKKKKGK